MPNFSNDFQIINNNFRLSYFKFIPVILGIITVLISKLGYSGEETSLTPVNFGLSL